ncbi:MAG TPA: TolC family protein [Bacteroidales bacterium]|nr:TolC family protein [Bacteroidales bacterium]
MKRLSVAAFLFISIVLHGQDVLDEYIKYGLENNLALQQKQANYRISVEALKQARALFYPDLSFQARYTVSEGGRVIDFPVGDLLNPVYQTLNNLTSSSLFPFVENQQINFLRPQEQETKLRLIQPVFNTDIYYNARISREMTILDEYDVNQYRRELVSEIRKAYYNAAMAESILQMLSGTKVLLAENVRVNTKLLENDKITRDYLFRSEAEMSKLEQELQNAWKNKTLAFSYFNFLLNKPLEDTIIIVTPEKLPSLSVYSEDYSSLALENREELKKLESYIQLSDLKIKMDNSGKLPELFVAVDYGFEGTTYRFNSDRDYVQASAVLSWNLFKGFQNRSKIKQSVIEKEIAEKKLEETGKQIEMQVMSIMNGLLASEKGIAAAESRLKNANESFRLVNRRYQEGQASLIEFIDARTTMTQANENLIISRFNYLSDYAEFEKAVGSYKPE